MRILVSVLVVLFVAVSSQSFAADAEKAVEIKPAPVAAQAPVAIEVNVPAVDVNAVVLTVNGKKITEGQLEKLLAPRLKQAEGRIPPDKVAEYKNRLRKQAMEMLIIETVLAEKQIEKNIVVTEAELAADMNSQLAQQNLSMDEFKSLLKAYGVDYADYQENMKKRAGFEKLMNAEFAGKVKEPNDTEIKAYYDENLQKEFTKPEMLHAKHILVRPADDANDPNKAKAEAKAKAQELLAKVKGGAEFEAVAKESSACPSAKEGGDLGQQPKGALVPEFEKAAYALKPGEISDVVETQFGFHIIKLVAVSEANTVSLEEAKAKIVSALTDGQKEQIVTSYIKNIKANVDVKFANEADKFELNAPEQAPPVRKAPAAAPKAEEKPAETAAPAKVEEKPAAVEKKVEVKENTTVITEKPVVAEANAPAETEKKVDKKAEKAAKAAKVKAEKAAKKAKK